MSLKTEQSLNQLFFSILWAAWHINFVMIIDTHVSFARPSIIMKSRDICFSLNFLRLWAIYNPVPEGDFLGGINLKLLEFFFFFFHSIHRFIGFSRKHFFTVRKFSMNCALKEIPYKFKRHDYFHSIGNDYWDVVDIAKKTFSKLLIMFSQRVQNSDRMFNSSKLFYPGN